MLHSKNITRTTRTLQAIVEGDFLKNDPSTLTNHEVVWDGANCVPIHWNDRKIEMSKAKQIMEQLPVCCTKSIIFSLLSYEISLVIAESGPSGK